MARVESQPDITMPELSAVLQQTHGITADPAVVVTLPMPARPHV